MCDLSVQARHISHLNFLLINQEMLRGQAKTLVWSSSKISIQQNSNCCKIYRAGTKPADESQT